MKTVEIPANEWNTYFEDFSRMYLGSLVTIEMLDTSGQRVEIASEMPLERVVFDQSDPCNNVIAISVSEPGKRTIDHVVIDPIHVIVRETGDHKKLMEVSAENGTTLVGFHSGKLPEAVTSSAEGFTGRAAKERYV